VSDKPVPVVCFVGLSESGKTGVAERVIRVLSDLGWRVAAIKHHHTGELDTPGKDSWRYARAGAVSTALVGQEQYAIFKQVGEEPTVEDVLHDLGEADIIVIEGFRNARGAKIEVVRGERSSSTVSDPSDLLALVTDVEGLGGGVTREFGMDEHVSIAELIAGSQMLRHAGERAVPAGHCLGAGAPVRVLQSADASSRGEA
jgi:molybdopterin-guanine dinucleotide biosynthesis protein B